MGTHFKGRKDISRILLLSIVILISPFFKGCSPYKGHGVMLWTGEKLPFKTGEIINIKEYYHIDKLYIAEYQNTEYEIAEWRIMFFESHYDAEKFTQEYNPLINTYAFTKKNGLPVRKEPKLGQNKIYRLRSGQIIKVIGKTNEKTTIGNMVDYWYWILTDDGYLGYTYGWNLKIIESTGDVEEQVTVLMSEDPDLEKLLENVWRPKHVQDMIISGKIDLEYLKNDFSLIPHAGVNKIILNFEEFYREFIYIDILKPNPKTYSFSGTDLKIQMYPDDRIAVSYYDDDNLYVSKNFVLIYKNINNLITKEENRRKDMLFRFINNSSQLESGTYGIIILSKDNRFTWTDFEKLSSWVIPDNVSGNGRVDFPYYLSEDLHESYDGTITFYFDEIRDSGKTFLYKFAQDGVKMIFIKEENIDEEELEISRLGHSPLVIFFNFQ